MEWYVTTGITYSKIRMRFIIPNIYQSQYAVPFFIDEYCILDLFKGFAHWAEMFRADGRNPKKSIKNPDFGVWRQFLGLVYLGQGDQTNVGWVSTHEVDLGPK